MRTDSKVTPSGARKRYLTNGSTALARRSTIPVELDVTTERRLAEPIEAAAYFVASEALANATKHAHASRIEVSLAPHDGDVVIPKRRYSGFFGTDLDITLRERDVDTLRLVGDCTNICVLYTAADARNLGYAVEVVRDGVTSFDLEAHADALRELEKTLGATIVT